MNALPKAPLFKRSLSGGLRTIKDSQISNRTIRATVNKDLKLSTYGKSFLKKGLIKAQNGGLGPGEVKKLVQKGIDAGKFTRLKGKEVLKTFGFTKPYYKGLKGITKSNTVAKTNEVMKKNIQAVSEEPPRSNFSRQTPEINANLNTSRNNYSGQLKNSSYKDLNTNISQNAKSAEIGTSNLNSSKPKKTIWSVLRRSNKQ